MKSEGFTLPHKESLSSSLESEAISSKSLFFSSEREITSEHNDLASSEERDFTAGRFLGSFISLKIALAV